MKPFRFGINARDAGSRAEWQDKARRVEGLGYSALMVPDHLAAMLAPIPAAVSAAAATKSLRVGTNVLNNDFRHPVLVAREAATADLLSDGRFELGLGAGHMRSENDQAGLPFERGGVRLERLAEAVAIIKGLLGGAEVTFVGQHYRVTGHTIPPGPVQRPHPPIIIGAMARVSSRSPRRRPTSSPSRASPSRGAARSRTFPRGGWGPRTSACGSCEKPPVRESKSSS